MLRLQDEQLIAYFTSRQPVAAAQLRAHLLQHLPAAVVPQRFLPLDRLPLNRNGKLDEARLRAVASLTPMQEVVQAAWMDLLELEDVGLEDDFFDLGGHSLSAMRLIGMLRSVVSKLASSKASWICSCTWWHPLPPFVLVARPSATTEPTTSGVT